MLALCSLYVRSMFAVGSLYARSMFALCSLHVRSMFALCSQGESFGMASSNFCKRKTNIYGLIFKLQYFDCLLLEMSICFFHSIRNWSVNRVASFGVISCIVWKHNRNTYFVSARFGSEVPFRAKSSDSLDILKGLYFCILFASGS